MKFMEIGFVEKTKTISFKKYNPKESESKAVIGK